MLEQTIYHKDSDKIMIIKPNTLIEAGFDLSEAEHDLMTLAINKLHKQKTGGRRVLISAKEFANANQVNEIYAYRVLRETAKVLGERKLKFTLYMDKNIPATSAVNQLTVIKPTHSNFTTLRSEYNWLQGVSYQDQMGFIILDFSEPLAFHKLPNDWKNWVCKSCGDFLQQSFDYSLLLDWYPANNNDYDDSVPW